MFLDEVSFDNRGMLRKRGLGICGKKILVRGEFTRKPLVSLLCFINVNGLVESFMTEGTFNRLKFVDCLRSMVSSGNVQQYPVRNSIWIMDGASIHCHEDIVYYLRSCGIVPLFLPAYCPFFNPIEVLFGLVKKKMQREYDECKTSQLQMFVISELNKFCVFDSREIFKKCGYVAAKRFNPGHEYNPHLDGDETFGFFGY